MNQMSAIRDTETTKKGIRTHTHTSCSKMIRKINMCRVKIRLTIMNNNLQFSNKSDFIETIAAHASNETKTTTKKQSH